jgi:hypothetical protein
MLTYPTGSCLATMKATEINEAQLLPLRKLIRETEINTNTVNVG